MTREIKGPEDCIPYEGEVNFGGCIGWYDCQEVFTAQEVGHIIALAMDAAEKAAYDDFDPHDTGPANAWRELAERLRGK